MTDKLFGYPKSDPSEDFFPLFLRFSALVGANRRPRYCVIGHCKQLLAARHGERTGAPRFCFEFTGRQHQRH